MREHFFQILCNIYKAKLAAVPEVTINKTVADFADSASVPAWAITATNELIKRGIIKGDGSKLQIGDAFNNATTAAVLAKFGGVAPVASGGTAPAQAAAEPKKHDGEAEETEE
ncbi:hypothetical protein FACS18949_16770 [Clostridia bacterium]|nr:hypothetical protein FACS18949_16770 [Clostridia bacterium]